LPEGLLQNSGLGIDSVKYCLVAVRVPLGSQIYNPQSYLKRLVPFVIAVNNNDWRSRLSIGPEILLLPAHIVDHNSGCSLENIPGGSVIPFQPDHRGVRIVLLELQNVAKSCATPSIYTLIIISDHTEIPVLGGQHGHQHVLRVIGVLIFIYQDVQKSLLVGLEDVGSFTEQPHGQTQKIIEIESIIGSQAGFIFLIDLCGRQLVRGSGTGGKSFQGH